MLSFCFGPSTGSGQAITLRSNTSTTTGRQTLNLRRTLGPRTLRRARSRSSSRSLTNGSRFFHNGALIARSSVSTGTQGHPTPLGVFSVISKQRWHRSNIYSAAPMPYMQRITWSGIAVHAGVLPRHPASHGCIRLKNDFAIRLWRLTKRGTRVIIAPEDIGPVEIAHPYLAVSRPKAASGPPESRAAIADHAAMTTAAVRPPPTPNAETQQVADLQAPGSMRAAVA